MDTCMEKVYDLTYMPIISPYNLLENAKLPNYNYVRYYNSADGLIAEMECMVEGKGLTVFYYHFDKNDYLQKIFMESNGMKELVFDRQESLTQAKLEYYNSKPDYKEAI